jgi:DNA (cytosine-5)-methyltransferase 1
VDRFVLKAEHKFIVGSRTDASGVGSAQLAPSLVRVAHGEMTKAGKKRGKGEHALTEPLPTVVASREFALVTPILVPHITKFRTGSVGSAIDAPMPTVTANSYVKRPGGCAPLGLVSATLIQTGYGERKGQAPRVPGLHKPLGTIVAGAVKHAVVEIELVASHMLKLKGTCKDGFPLTEPMHTVQASGLHYAEVRTLLRRMEVLPEESDVATTVIDGVTYAVADIGLRMLTPRELFRAQGFPDSYIIDGRFRGKPMTQTNQVKMCGNSVVPHLAAALVRANFAAVLPAAQERAA